MKHGKQAEGRVSVNKRAVYDRAMESIVLASTDQHYAIARRLFGAYQRTVEEFASDAEICA